jgi:glucuronokinase
MRLIRKKAYARAGLIGNPSDGYFGRTLSLVVPNFFAEVTLYPWDQVELVWGPNDQSRFRSVDELVQDVRLHGYYGGIRLVRATIKKFVDYCSARRIPLRNENFSVRYETNIPRLVGLAGSSAIIVATLRCLMEFYDVAVPQVVQPSLALSVETEELGIVGGLQDRVAQVYEGLVYMDFSRDKMQEVTGLPCGVYEPLDPKLLPPLYVAYCDEVSSPTETIHNNLRARFEQGEPAVLEAMRRLAELTVQAHEVLVSGHPEGLGAMIDQNFEWRRSICRLPAGQVEMVECARRAGGTAHFAGSGGAIIGTYPDQATYGRITHDLEAIGCRVIQPRLAG